VSFNMVLWTVEDGNLTELPKERLDNEDRLEQWITDDVSLLGLNVLIIGRQVRTPSGGRIDLLAIDQQGDIVLLELKRDRTPREVVAQALDYVKWTPKTGQLNKREFWDRTGQEAMEGCKERGDGCRENDSSMQRPLRPK